MGRVLIACECSGRTRNAFRALGHDAYSCDILPAEDGPTPFHIKDSFEHVLCKYPHRWDLIIAHPPCDYLANCGSRWRAERGEWQEMQEAAEFFMWCLEAPICPVAVENPVMNRKRSGIRKADFSIQPWMFGDMETKRTCFWTKGLPALLPEITTKPHGVKASVHREPPGPDRKANRSRTFPGIARAMAEQWGAFIDGEDVPLLEVANG